jgi:hypothetical protein
MSFTPHVSQGDGTDVASFQNPDGSVGARFDQWGRPRQGTGDAPTVAVGAAAGSSATVTAHSGTDSHGTITITTGASGWSGNALATVTFAVPFTGTNPPIVQLEPKDSHAAALYYATCTNTVLTVNVVTTPASASAYAFDYFVVCGA